MSCGARGMARGRTGLSRCERLLEKPQRVAIGIVHVELARAPRLINRAFVHVLRRIRIAGRLKSPCAKLEKRRRRRSS